MAKKANSAPTAYSKAMRDLAKGAGAAAVIGVFVNVLYLAMPIYHAQIYDRVISSGNFDTLIALTVIVVMLLTFQAMLDFMRSKLFMVLAARLSTQLGRPVFEAAVENALNHGPSSANTALRDLSSLRSFVAGGAITLPLDLAFTPILVAVLLMLHPYYGLVGLAGALILSVAAFATEILARRPVAEATRASGAAQAEAGAAIRNAEVIAAMGMLPAVARRWRSSQAKSLDRIENGRTAAKALAAVARGLRLGLQIAVICAGAVVVIGQEASPGTIMAATVITSRMLSPFEHLIDGWRQWVTAFSTLRRLRELLEQGGNMRSAHPVEISNADLRSKRAGYPLAAQCFLSDRAWRNGWGYRPIWRRKVHSCAPGCGALVADRRRHLPRWAKHLSARAGELRRGGRIFAAGASSAGRHGSRKYRAFPGCEDGGCRRCCAAGRCTRIDRSSAEGL
jgi:ATP-binding cassette subfamily C protein